MEGSSPAPPSPPPDPYPPSPPQPSPRPPNGVHTQQHSTQGQAARIIPQKTLPTALKVHPKGFKILSRESPVERALRSYFRLPLPATKQKSHEMSRVKRMLRMKGRGRMLRKRVLDGFFLLEACHVEDPEDAVEAVVANSSLTGVVPDDLSFFTSLEFLDIGENQVEFAELSNLTNLEELHMHCCLLHQISVPEGSFLKLETLNVSFNSLSEGVFTNLSKLPSLVRLDLSCNNLKTLPEDMSGLVNLQQLALEGNELSSESTFHSLGSLGRLREVNLNRNKLSKVPKLLPGGFPALEILGLAACDFHFFEDLYSLTEYKALRRVVLWGNPIERRRKDTDILVYEMGTLDVQVILDGPLPPRRKVGEFYVAQAKNMRKVREFKHVIRRPTFPSAKSTADVPVSSTPNDQPFTSFFMTEPPPDNAEEENVDAVHRGPPRNVSADLDRTKESEATTWFNLDDSRPVFSHGLEGTSFEADVQELLQTPATPDPVESMSSTRKAGSTSAVKFSARPRPTLRSALKELKQAMREPLTCPHSTTLTRRRGPRRAGQFVNVNDPDAFTHSNLPPIPPPSSSSCRGRLSQPPCGT
eukprot:Sspe_Gene.34182::Locus_16630_Transcript_1_1_Confidence_1.000_Length_1915::g.34182::m.34182